MTKTEAKAIARKWGLYELIHELEQAEPREGDNITEVIYSILDNIPSETLKEATKKATSRTKATK